MFFRSPRLLTKAPQLAAQFRALKMRFDQMGIQYVLVDIDGTMIDTEQDCARRLSMSLTQWRSTEGVGGLRFTEVSPEYYEQHLQGRGIFDIFRRLVINSLNEDITSQSLEKCVKQLLGIYTKICQQHTHVEARLEPTHQTVAELAKYIPVAFVSNEYYPIVKSYQKLFAESLQQCPAFTPGPNDVGKPFPYLYEYVLRHLQRYPHEAIAIEDSIAGTRAAVRANIPTIRVVNTSESNEDASHGARMVTSALTLASIHEMLDVLSAHPKHPSSVSTKGLKTIAATKGA